MAKQIRGGYQHGGVAGPAAGDDDRHRLAGDATDGVDDLFDRMPAAGPDIVGDAACLEVVQGEDVGLGQVGHVDVVADAGAIGGRIVGAEQLEGRAPAERRVDGERDQVCFRIMVFAQSAVRVRACGVEVAQAGTA